MAIEKKFRVLRVIEYIYDSPEQMVEDRKHWVVQGTERMGRVVLNSAVVTTEVVIDEEDDEVADEVVDDSGAGHGY